MPGSLSSTPSNLLMALPYSCATAVAAEAATPPPGAGCAAASRSPRSTRARPQLTSARELQPSSSSTYGGTASTSRVRISRTST
jgi:hypothetical protein